MIQESERPLVYAGGGIIAAGASAGTARIRRAHRRARRLHPDGPGRLPSEHPNFISMPGMHGSYAANMAMTQCRPADRPRRALRRPRHRPPGRLRAARQGHPRGYRSGRDRQESRARCSHRGRREARARQAQQAARGRRRSRPPRSSRPRARAWWRQIRDWKEEHPLQAGHLRHRDQAAAPDGRNRPPLRRPGHRHLRRRPAPDVGRAAHPLQRAAPVAQLRAASAPWASACPSAIGAQFARPDKLVFAIVGDGGFQMSIPELATVASYGLPIKIIVHEQRLPGHGAPVAGRCSTTTASAR